jgi:hypothetical protein
LVAVDGDVAVILFLPLLVLQLFLALSALDLQPLVLLLIYCQFWKYNNKINTWQGSKYQPAAGHSFSFSSFAGDFVIEKKGK